MRCVKSSELGRWFFTQGSACVGTVLLVHGLNQNPIRWQDLIDELTGWGLDVLRLDLTGHRGLPFADMHRVRAEMWLEEFATAYTIAVGHHSNLPLYFVGFSLGGLLAETAQIREKRALFDRQVLLAPALSFRLHTLFVLPMIRLFPSLPSRAPRAYRANRQGTTASAYRALFHLKAELAQSGMTPALNIPTRVMMRDGDELVSHRGIARFISRHGLSRWRLLTIPPLPNRMINITFRHLIIDRKALGYSSWNRMMENIHDFLINGDESRQSF